MELHVILPFPHTGLILDFLGTQPAYPIYQRLKLDMINIATSSLQGSRKKDLGTELCPGYMMEDLGMEVCLGYMMSFRSSQDKNNFKKNIKEKLDLSP